MSTDLIDMRIHVLKTDSQQTMLVPVKSGGKYPINTGIPVHITSKEDKNHGNSPSTNLRAPLARAGK